MAWTSTKWAGADTYSTPRSKRQQAADLAQRGSVRVDAGGVYVLDHDGTRHDFADLATAASFAKQLYRAQKSLKGGGASQ